MKWIPLSASLIHVLNNNTWYPRIRERPMGRQTGGIQAASCAGPINGQKLTFTALNSYCILSLGIVQASYAESMSAPSTTRMFAQNTFPSSTSSLFTTIIIDPGGHHSEPQVPPSTSQAPEIGEEDRVSTDWVRDSLCGR